MLNLKSAEEINKRLKNWSTFTLEDGKAYINFFKMGNQDTFIMIKMERFGLCALVKVAFLIGVPIDDRLKYFDDIKSSILGEEEKDAGASDFMICRVIRKPIQKILIKYKHMPRNFLAPPLLAHKSEEKDDKDPSGFNWHVSSYLHHRRVVWNVESHSLKAVNDILMESFRGLLSERFQVVYSGEDCEIP